MQVTETLCEGLKRGYTIIISGADMATEVDAKINAIQPDYQMKGFRKGKAPISILKKMFGQNVMGEVVQESVDAAIRQLLEDKGDRPSQKPDVKITNESFEEGDDLNVDVSYERLPDIPEIDYKSISLERMVVKVEDSALDETLGKMAESATNYEPRGKTAKAKDGDQVVINFLGKIDGVPFDGGQADDYPLVLGSGSFIPGFEEQLVGVKTGDELDVNVSFPEEYGAENLAGKAAVFECKINEVRAPKASKIDDELGKKYGFEDLDGLKENLRGRLGEEYKTASRSHLKRKLLDTMDGLVEFDLPEDLLTSEAAQIAHQLWHEENPEVEGHDHPEIEPTDEHRKLAERRVRLGLLLAEIGRVNKIEVSEQEVNAEIMKQAQQYQGHEKAFFEYVRNNPEMMQQISAPVFEEKVVDYILELATISEREVTQDELKASLEALETD